MRLAVPPAAWRLRTVERRGGLVVVIVVEGIVRVEPERLADFVGFLPFGHQPVPAASFPPSLIRTEWYGVATQCYKALTCAGRRRHLATTLTVLAVPSSTFAPTRPLLGLPRAQASPVDGLLNERNLDLHARRRDASLVREIHRLRHMSSSTRCSPTSCRMQFCRDG